MALFPPWLYYDGSTSNQRSAGYHFLLNRPVAGTYQEMFGFDDDMTTEFVRVRLNRKVLSDLRNIIDDCLRNGIAARSRCDRYLAMPGRSKYRKLRSAVN